MCEGKGREMSWADRLLVKLSAPAGTRVSEVDPSHQTSQPGRAANFSNDPALAACFEQCWGFVYAQGSWVL